VIVFVAVLLLLSGGKIVASPSALLAMVRAQPSSFLTTMEVVTSVAAFVPQACFAFLPLVALTFQPQMLPAFTLCVVPELLPAVVLALVVVRRCRDRHHAEARK
jgi:hypothetical protein